MKPRGLVYSLVITLCLGAAWVNGQDTIYVSQDGICGGHIRCYSTIQDGINSVSLPSIIKITGEMYYEDVVLNMNQVITLEGGWDTSFTSCSSYTILSGSMTIADGTMVIEKTGGIILLPPPPTINSFTANPVTINSGQSSTLSWSILNAVYASIDQGVGSINPAGGSIDVSPATTTPYTLTATNAAGSDTAQVTVTVIRPPIITSFVVTPQTINLGESTTLSWSISDADSASIDHGVGGVNPSSGSVTVTPVSSTPYTLTATNVFGSVTAQLSVAVAGGIPPDPKDVAPGVDPTVASTVYSSTQFLYTGSNAIQPGITPGTIEANRAAVLRGKVLDREGAPLPGVRLTILNHPEYGYTLSRLDGMFDMVVNGGGLLNVRYEKVGYLTVQRQKDIPWQDYMWFPEVRMTQVAPNSTLIDLNSGEDFQVVRGNVITDERGTRQSTLLIPKGTQGQLVFSDGHQEPISSFTVHVTEFTVGPEGPDAMPAKLPPSTAYTYCEEFTVDEAVAAGAHQLVFSQPGINHLENFLDFPVGTIIPMGAYDRERSVWIPSQSGKVIKILSTTGGIADVDSDGDGVADDLLGITAAERQVLAGLYSAGQSLWRLPVPHLTLPWDGNMAVLCDEPCTEPKNDTPFQRDPCDNVQEGDNDVQEGSLIGCLTQVLAEEAGITGTPYRLRYQSDRVPGRVDGYTIKIPLTGAQLSPTLRKVFLEIEVAGRRFTQEFSNATGQATTFTWDGKDAYGRRLQGRWPITVSVGYAYRMIFASGPTWNRPSGVPITGSNFLWILWQVWKGTIGSWDFRSEGLGGWTLNAHHLYDVNGGRLYRGDGGTRSSERIGSVIDTVLSSPYSALAVRLMPNGKDLYLLNGYDEIVRLDPDTGSLTPVAGIGSLSGGVGFDGDGGPATQAKLAWPKDIAVGPDGSIYIADTGNHRIRRVGPDGIIQTIAGNGTCPYCEYNCPSPTENVPATDVSLCSPSSVDFGADGNLYILQQNSGYSTQFIRRVEPDGKIATVAGSFDAPNGCGTAGIDIEGKQATQVRLFSVGRIRTTPDGSLFMTAQCYGPRVLRIGPDGVLSTAVGDPTCHNNGCNLCNDYSCNDGLPADQATFYYFFGPTGLDIGKDGRLLITDGYGCVRVVDSGKTILTIAGTCGKMGFAGDGGLAAAALLNFPNDAIFTPDGKVYISEASSNGTMRRVAPLMQNMPVTSFYIPSDDGSEIYFFNMAGRHLSTLDSLTGAVLDTFDYDSKGHLIKVTDRNGNVTGIQRDASGNPTAILSPYGQQTNLVLDANGYLSSIVNPAGETTAFTYTADGLMTGHTTPRNFLYAYFYDSQGRLQTDQSPGGGSKSLSRVEQAKGYDVTVRTGMGRDTAYSLENLSTGNQHQVTTYPDATQTDTLNRKDGSGTMSLPDGTTIDTLIGPDPRFKMQSPLLKSMAVKTPGGLTVNVTGNHSVSLTDPNNPLSLTALTDMFTKNGQTYTTAYNAATKAFMNTTPVGRQSTKTIDSLGRVIRSQLSGLNATQYSYEPLGRPSTITQGFGPDARSYTLQYNLQGYLSSVTDSLSNVFSFEYDQAGRIKKEILPGGGQILYAYDPNGNVTSITPPGRPAHSFAYNPVDLMLEYDPPDVGLGTDLIQYTYNADRQVTQVLRPDGQTINYSYDAAGRLGILTTSDGSVTYTYDPSKGYLTGINWPGGNSISLTLDGLLITGETWGGEVSGSVSWTYDNNFRVTGISINGSNTMSYQRDSDGLITKAGDQILTRSAQNGFLTGTSLGNVTDSWTYNSFGEPASYVAKYNTSEIFTQGFTYDKLGRIIQRVETVNGITNTFEYAYNPRGNLTEVKKNGSVAASYSYDSNANRLTGPSNATTYTYDAQDRLMTRSSVLGTQSYSYSASGDLQSKTVGSQLTQYGYDAFGDLKAVTLSNGIVVEYSVDGVGRRTGRKTNATWDGKVLYLNDFKPVAELDGNNNVVSLFVYGTRTSIPDYMITGNGTYRIISDHLGSPRLMIDVATGSVAQRMDYDEFGRVILDTNPGFQPFGFAGGIYDQQTGLVHFGARDYDTETGRWTTKDPILFNGQQQNLYAYVSNDPVNRVDPAGTQGDVEAAEGIKADAARNAAAAAAASGKPSPPETPPSGGGSGPSSGGAARPNASVKLGPGDVGPTSGHNHGRAVLDALIKKGILKPVKCLPYLDLLRLILFPQSICDDYPGFPGCGPLPYEMRKQIQEIKERSRWS